MGCLETLDPSVWMNWWALKGKHSGRKRIAWVQTLSGSHGWSSKILFVEGMMLLAGLFYNVFQFVWCYPSLDSNFNEVRHFGVVITFRKQNSNWQRWPFNVGLYLQLCTAGLMSNSTQSHPPPPRICLEATFWRRFCEFDSTFCLQSKLQLT